MNENALVLEGGGFRGMYTAGVLDVLMEHGIWDFTSVWGVSAGAIAASSYKSRQIGRSMRIMLAFRDNPRFMSLWSFATTGDIAGSDFLYDEVQGRLDPADH
ncbi:MAG: patatin-like phospholipase family protein, partial [Atopobiaceae bacterium]|nr:patatin-like phospholipase family protein [Atopobiaceae bacterium]